LVLYFFFQAEDGIRDRNVTGVQTCALPILCRFGIGCRRQTCNGYGIANREQNGLQRCFQFCHALSSSTSVSSVCSPSPSSTMRRSEERRVGKECRSLWSWSRSESKWRSRRT